MVETHIKDGKLFLKRTAEEQKPLILRLNRLEGQIRGLRTMIEEDRYCGEELQQIKAAIAALREVGLAILEQHVSAAAEHAGTSLDRALSEDLLRVLREARRL